MISKPKSQKNNDDHLSVSIYDILFDRFLAGCKVCPVQRIYSLKHFGLSKLEYLAVIGALSYNPVLNKEDD